LLEIAYGTTIVAGYGVSDELLPADDVVLVADLRHDRERGSGRKNMIELLPDMPEGVTGVRVSGRLGGDELREVKPTIEQMMNTDEIRIVEVIAPDYEGFGPGGLLEDLKLAFTTVWPHHSAFKRIAVVSDEQWVALTLHALAWLIPGELAVFKLDELDKAKEWAAG
jgi:SpoIIAA-like